jgi:hypothetical protein
MRADTGQKGFEEAWILVFLTGILDEEKANSDNRTGNISGNKHPLHFRERLMPSRDNLAAALDSVQRDSVPHIPLRKQYFISFLDPLLPYGFQYIHTLSAAEIH